MCIVLVNKLHFGGFGVDLQDGAYRCFRVEVDLYGFVTFAWFRYRWLFVHCVFRALL